MIVWDIPVQLFQVYDGSELSLPFWDDKDVAQELIPLWDCLLNGLFGQHAFYLFVHCLLLLAVNLNAMG